MMNINNMVKFFVCLHSEHEYQISFVETSRKLIIAKLLIHKLGS